MRFARTGAGLIVLVVLLSPVVQLVRELFLTLVSSSATFDGLLTVGRYVGALLVLYGTLIAVLLLVRWVLRFLEVWQGSGLDLLDDSVPGVWPRWSAVVLGIGAIGAAMLTGRPPGVPAIVEVAIAFLAVFVAVMDRTSVPDGTDDYDPLPQPHVPEPQPEPSPAPPGEIISRILAWYFRREPGDMSATPASYEVRLQASKSRYDAFLQQDHSVRSNQDYVRFVRDGMTPEVADVSWQVRGISQRDHLGTIGEINNVLAFAQRFRYVLDSVDKGKEEYPKFPLETLIDDRGDCEDHAILAAACLINLGYDARLVAVDYGSGAGHMALAVAAPEDLPGAFFLRESASGQRFYYCEVTTNAGSRQPDAIAFRMGDAPAQAQQAQLTLLPRA